MKKRDFIKYGGLLTGALITGCNNGQSDKMRGKTKTGSPLRLKYKPYTLQLRHVFTLASGSRTTTPVVLTQLECDGFTGYGEASMPPYLGESHESVLKFLGQVNMEQFNDPFLIEDIIDYIDNIAPGNYAAKASIDIALHDLTGKILGEPWYRLWGLDPSRTPYTSFTIGIDNAEVVKQKVAEAEPYKILKVKLGLGNDREMIETIRTVSEKPICVDVNQGWKDKNYALEMAHWLRDQNVVFLEQPMPKTQTDDIAWLTQNAPLPVIADEAVQTTADLFKVKDIYSGINIKLMKCGGMNAAHKMALMAREMGMKVMIGCMTETSCAISAAAQVSPLVDWADLDGNLLISNDVYEGVTVDDGKITLKERPGIGIVEMKKIFED
ncbi:MAG TPA: dipeptide epimerase [Bacteroidales bacterium]|nr:dipeptide epimerase [Bacteroidales bacterium]HQM68743.1 dipeptide epimerase [Bacteroidales bacterium]